MSLSLFLFCGQSLPKGVLFSVLPGLLNVGKHNNSTATAKGTGVARQEGKQCVQACIHFSAFSVKSPWRLEF